MNTSNIKKINGNKTLICSNSFRLSLFLAILIILCNITIAKDNELPSISKIKENLSLMPDTIFYDNNTAYVKAKERSIDIDKFEANNSDIIVLNIDSQDLINEVCFEFPVNLKYITIKTIKLNIPLWFDADLKDKEKKEGNKICYTNINIKKNNLYFSIEYNPIYGMNKRIKYNITTDSLVLDPYIIGNLATSYQLISYLPYNNNSSITWSQKNNSATASSIRRIAGNDGNVTVTDYTDAIYSTTYFYDNSYSTYAYTTTSSTGYFTFEVNKTGADTGIIWEVKDQTVGFGGAGVTTNRFTNYTIPDSCFNYHPNTIIFKVSLQMEPTGVGDYSLQCESGGWTSLLTLHEANYASSIYLYETSWYMTNLSGYSAFSQPFIPVQYYNNKSLNWSYSFMLRGNNSVEALRNDMNKSLTGTAANVSFNDSGANFNGTSNIYIASMQKFNNGSTEETMCAKVKLNVNAFVHDQPIMGSWYSQNHQMKLVSGYKFKYDLDTYTASASTTSPDAYNDGNYHLVCGVYNGSMILLYVDGTNVSQTALTGLIKTGTDAFCIGAASGGATSCQISDYVFNGSIADVKLYNRALTSNELYIMYKGGNFSANKLGEANSSLYLNGFEYLEIRNDTVFDASANSICFWKNATATNNIMFGFSTSFYGQQYGENYGIRYPLDGIMASPSNEWHHVCSVTNGSVMKLYHDGVLINTTSTTDTLTSNTYKYIGRLYDEFTSQYNYKGYLDEFMIYNYALTDSEIYILSQGYSPLNWLNITQCIGDDEPFLTYNVYDESNVSLLSATSVTFEISVNLSSSNSSTLWAIKTTGSNPLTLCMPKGFKDSYNFSADVITKFYDNEHVVRYDFIQDYLINSTSTSQNITLYDLSNSLSTTFLVTYQDEYYFYQPGVLIDLYKKFIGYNNQYYSVESALTDQSGQTRLHMQPEDIIYKIIVWQNNNIVYQTDDFFALCLESPCTITLRKQQNVSNTNNISNLIYTITNDSAFRAAKSVDFDYVTTDGTSQLIRLVVYNSSNTVVCNTSISGSSGSLNCTINPTYQNQTYTALVSEGNTVVGYNTYSTQIKGSDVFGDMGIFLGAIGYLILALMGISSPIISLILGAIGLIAMSILMFINIGSIIGPTSTLIWLICAIGILAWKFKSRR